MERSGAGECGGVRRASPSLAERVRVRPSTKPAGAPDSSVEGEGMVKASDDPTDSGRACCGKPKLSSSESSEWVGDMGGVCWCTREEPVDAVVRSSERDSSPSDDLRSHEAAALSARGGVRAPDESPRWNHSLSVGTSVPARRRCSSRTRRSEEKAPWSPWPAQRDSHRPSRRERPARSPGAPRARPQCADPNLAARSAGACPWDRARYGTRARVEREAPPRRPRHGQCRQHAHPRPRARGRSSTCSGSRCCSTRLAASLGVGEAGHELSSANCCLVRS